MLQILVYAMNILSFDSLMNSGGSFNTMITMKNI